MIKTSHKSPIMYLLLLILAGEAVFILPFVLARVFRATVLDVFQITNTELGYCFSIYGLVALASYLFGGPLADTYAPRKLMGVGLILTALGGLVYANDPSLFTLKVLYGFWGFTTIFLFWAAMIKATRVWGGIKNQGKAFGFLDGGRGLVGALFGGLGVFIFSLFIITEGVALNTNEQAEAFQAIVYSSSAIVAVVGVIVFFFLKTDESEDTIIKEKITRQNINQVLKLPAVWLLMVIILCAYVGYKITDIFSLYAKQVMKYSEVDAAKTGTFLLFIRPIVGVVIGFLADRSRASLFLCFGFLFSIYWSLTVCIRNFRGQYQFAIFPLHYYNRRWGILCTSAILRSNAGGEYPSRLNRYGSWNHLFCGIHPRYFCGTYDRLLLRWYAWKRWTSSCILDACSLFSNWSYILPIIL